MVDTYLESMLGHSKTNETIDQRTSQWIDDIRTVLPFLNEGDNTFEIFFFSSSFYIMFDKWKYH